MAQQKKRYNMLAIVQDPHNPNDMLAIIEDGSFIRYVNMRPDDQIKVPDGKVALTYDSIEVLYANPKSTLGDLNESRP